MSILWLYSAFLTGFLGSLHCIGMCGPIAAALPLGNLKPSEKAIRIFIYHLARIIGYSLMGVLVGFFGKTVLWAAGQQVLTIITGVLLILMYSFNKTSYLPWLGRYLFLIKQFFSKNLAKKGVINFTLAGFTNGFLPCGLVYLSISIAMVAATPFTSALIMFVFGLGTIPALISVKFAATYLSGYIKWNVTKIAPIFAVAIGTILIFRGLNLNIPYLSPKIHDTGQIECCKKSQK